MPLDAQNQAIIDRMRQVGGTPLNDMTPQEARARIDAMPREKGPEVAEIKEFIIPVSDGVVSVRIYKPAGGDPLPAMIWGHGGGWVVGGHNMSDWPCRRLANSAACVAVSADFRLAPEHKFPIPPEDFYAVTDWVAQNAASLGVDPARIAVAGEAAGGGLAAAAALMARDRGGPEIMFQLLVSPMVSPDFKSTSHRENGTGLRLTTDMVEWYWGLYLSNESETLDPYAAPIHGELSGLPPALVISPEYDPLRDDGKAYAARLKEAGVRVTYSEYAGQIHGFMGMTEEIDRAEDAMAEATKALRDAFGN